MVNCKWAHLLHTKAFLSPPKWMNFRMNPKRGEEAEMQKAASMASMLVLIFSPPVLIFEHPAQNVVN